MVARGLCEFCGKEGPALVYSVRLRGYSCTECWSRPADEVRRDDLGRLLAPRWGGEQAVKYWWAGWLAVSLAAAVAALVWLW